MAHTDALSIETDGSKPNSHLDAPSEPTPPGRPGHDAAIRLGRPRSLPGGRAMAGGLLVAAAALLTFFLAGGEDDGPDTTYVVATRDLRPGTPVGPDDIDLRPMSLSDEVAAGAFSDTDDLAAAMVLAPVDAGELVQASTVIASDAAGAADIPDARQLSFEVGRSRAVAGRLEPGERVDLLATYGTGSDSRTTVVVRDALVVDMDSDGGGNLDIADAVTVTLGLQSDLSVLRVTHALDSAAVTLVRSTARSDEPAGPDEYTGLDEPEAPDG